MDLTGWGNTSLKKHSHFLKLINGYFFWGKAQLNYAKDTW